VDEQVAHDVDLRQHGDRPGRCGGIAHVMRSNMEAEPFP
jgi:hypothetical protein